MKDAKIDLDFDQKKYPRKYVADPKRSEYYSVSSMLEPSDRYGGDATVEMTYVSDKTIDVAIKRLQEIKTSLGKKLNGDDEIICLFEGKTYYEGDTAPLSWQVVRPENDKEYSARVNKILGKEKAMADYERQQYETLKKKFGGDNGNN